MLNGLAPILIYHFGALPASVTSALGGIPLVGGLLAENFTSIPIPVYLDENLSGLLVETQNKNISIETVLQPKYASAEAPDYTQRVTSTGVTINLVGLKDSLVLTTILAFSDKLIPLIANRRYSISYLNGPITVFNALLGSFSVNEIENTNKLAISMTLESTNKKETTTPFTTTPIAPVVGPTPGL